MELNEILKVRPQAERLRWPNKTNFSQESENYEEGYNWILVFT